ncbi:MAG TPA: hypothetical protein VMA95_14820, partial [Streptosporangiaceae bacterium]|nr:hypothetical protein [Streptosporangiaceae bacterium]
GRCLILDGLAEDIPLITGIVERTARQLPAAGALTAAERDLARTTAVQLTLGAAIPGRPRVAELAVPNPASLVGGQLGGSWGGDPAWWAGVRQRARTADPGTVAGRADLTTAITLNGRVTRERTRLRLEARDRLRRQLASFRLAPPIALLSFLALVLLTWSAAVISQAISFGDSQLLSTMPQQAFLDHTLGRFASVRVFDLVPLIVLVAVASALPRLGRSVLAVGVTLLTAASLAASRTPAFPAAFAPGFVRGWLTSAAAGTHLLTGIAAVFIAPAAAIVCLAFAVRLSRVQYPPRPARWLAGIPAGIRHLVSGAITFVVLESVLWTVVVTRETLSDPSGSAFPGSLAADYQSGLLLACAVFAVVAAFPGAYGAHRVLVTGVIGATIVSIWSLPAALFRWLWHPVASSLLSGFASLWGTEAFWAAVVFAAPIAVAGLVVSARLRAG